MKSQEIVNQINRRVTGEYSSIEYQSDDWYNIVSAANDAISSYNKAAKWKTQYDKDYSIGEATGDTEFTLDWSAINFIDYSNRASIQFRDTNGSVIANYKIVGVDVFESSDDSEIAMITSTGLEIKPYSTTSSVYGAEMFLPIYRKVQPITKLDQIIEIDDEYYIIDQASSLISSASPVAFISRNSQSQQQSALQRMKIMKKENRSSQKSNQAIGQWSPLGGGDWN